METLTVVFVAVMSMAVNTLAEGPCQQEYNRVDKIRQDNIAKTGYPLYGLHFPTCLADGTFAGLQCKGPMCRCVTPEGNDLIPFQDVPTSRNMNCKCAREQHEFRLTGFVGRMFDCDEIGNYRSVQCNGSMCYCVNPSGKQLGASVHITKTSSLNC